MPLFNEVQPLPESVTLSQIIKSIPKEAFEKDDSKAIKAIFITLTSTALGVYLIHISPWWLLPFVWFYTGTALTGFFVIGHDCGHRAFLKSMFWNDIVGSFAFAPILYPFHAWRVQHNVHHNNTNKLYVDTAWQPVQGKDYMDCGPFNRFLHRIVRGPVYYIGSIGHWFYEHLDMSLFKGEDLEKVKTSTSFLTYFSLIFFPLMYSFAGLLGIAKYWFVPWLCFHFWMSTFTLVHHTAPHIPFLDESEWRDSVAALQHTVHCRYPAWVDFLCHDISVHVPHHISPAIPHYRLRLAYDSIKKNWGPYVQETTFGFELMWYIVSNCQIYDEDTSLYRTFAALLQSAGLINPAANAKHGKGKKVM